ncbi:aldose 1-epimerase [Streptomyces sp. TRM 70361]|uniref:aldose epimerase family protein n=1 Tax=Streptomyces sp. TRM 70361 TaxID=3116553 RepID=UPI002E7C1704|nr:aldose 1-epimerase [Streptomyces sp. TRM 70361]MEE1941747.1 aldose 1-epimerase [Streptomyces sp. TRM 70361]
MRNDAESGVRLRAGDTEVTVEPERGCRIASLRIGGTEVLRQGERFGSFVMVPWCGRTRQGRLHSGGETYQLPVDSGEHAIHGTVRRRAWRTARSDERAAAFFCDLTEPWPWPGRVTQLVELAEDGAGLTLTLGVETFGDSFPAQAGWHPWFLRNLGRGGGDVTLDFAPAWQEERGADQVPTGRRTDPGPGPWDDCFGMPDGVDVTLTWPGELELRVTSRCEWVVVYDEQAEAVCVEPQTGPPNGLNTHPRLVTPIDPLEATTTWTWRRPDQELS